MTMPAGVRQAGADENERMTWVAEYLRTALTLMPAAWPPPGGTLVDEKSVIVAALMHVAADLVATAPDDVRGLVIDDAQNVFYKRATRYDTPARRHPL